MASRLLLVLTLCFGIGASGYILPCYVNRFAELRTDYSLDDIPLGCTHLIVAYAQIKPEIDFNVYTYDDYSFFERVNSVKKIQRSDIKTLISIGGPNTDSWMFSTVMKDEQKKNKFCNHLVELIKKFEFDGIDIAWFYPSANDKEAFNQLISCVNGSDHIVTATVSGKPHVIAHHYDVPAMAKTDLAWINVMSFDYHDEHDTHTGMIAPLFPGLGDHSNNYVAYALSLWAALGFPKNKIVMGVSAHGHGWHLADPNNSQVGAPAHPSPPFVDSNTKGLVAYYEVCQYLYEEKMWSDYQLVPYKLYNGTFWFSFENPQSIEYKTYFVVKNGFGGAFVYTIDFDDYKSYCPESRPWVKLADHKLYRNPWFHYPFALTNAVAEVLTQEYYERPPPVLPPWSFNYTGNLPTYSRTKLNLNDV